MRTAAHAAGEQAAGRRRPAWPARAPPGRSPSPPARRSTASSTTPATTPACCWASHVAGNTVWRSLQRDDSSSGATASATSVSSGEQEQHDDQRHDEQQDVAEHDRQERQQALHQADVGAGPADQLAGVQLVVAGEVEPLEVVVDAVRRSFWTSRLTRPPSSGGRTRRRTGRRRPTSEQRDPRADRAAGRPTMQSSTMTFSTSGVSAAIAVPTRAAPERDRHLAAVRPRKVASRRIHPVVGGRRAGRRRGRRRRGQRGRQPADSALAGARWTSLASRASPSWRQAVTKPSGSSRASISDRGARPSPPRPPSPRAGRRR